MFTIHSIKSVYVCVFIIVIIAVTNTLTAQRQSPLFQYMSSNTMIELPEEFREMQFAIEKETNNTKPGINADIFYKKISILKNDILNRTKITLVQDADRLDCIISYIGAEIVKVSVNSDGGFNEKSMRMLYDELELNIQNKISALSTKVFGSFGEKSKIAMIKAIAIGLRDQSLLKRSDVEETNFENILARLIVEQIEEVIENTVKGSDENSTFKSIRDNFKNKVDDMTEAVNNLFRDRLLKAFTIAEDKLYEVIKSFSSVLISANSGIGITEGTGMFNGGVHVNWNASEHIQGGIYLNGEISREDSIEPARSLLGLQARYTVGIVQLDVLASYLFGDNNFNIDKNNSSYEFGFGFGFSLKNSVIGAAIAIRQSYADIIGESISWVITYRAASPDSPILMAGFARTVPEEFTPVFNISLPIH